MDPETLNVLPFRCAFHPTLENAEEVRSILESRVPCEIAIEIVSFGYSPWLAKRRVHEEQYHTELSSPGAAETEFSITGLYLSSERIPVLEYKAIPRRIIFQTRAADQGWATFGGHGTFSNSHTWFEASILRPINPSTQANGSPPALEDVLVNTWWDVESARSDLNEQGWDFVQSEDGQLTWKTCNNITAQYTYQNYWVEWIRGIETEVEDERAKGKGEGFLELLEPGFIVVLWARAVARAWKNRVKAATIEIEYELT
ncbi:hypothetical protein M434DRAFT_175952 [Hypoxylon sp. CO27-5]|nr:hypothetical protein M434DRAFT_175952 [Hypoxylon sp. CO27-5]